MRFVTRRPRFTAGMPVPGFPAIKTALYADKECEVYRLDVTGSRNLLLVGVRHHKGGSAPEPEQLERWLAHHGCERLARLALSPKVRDLVVRVHGTWMGEVRTQPLRKTELYALLSALIELATDAADSDLTAVPLRPLLWIEGPPDEQRLASVYVRAATGNEAEVVRQIGHTFLSAATGVSSAQAELLADDERLASWCQNADVGLSQLISQCLDPSAPIANLGELHRQFRACLADLAASNPVVEQTASRYVGLSPRRFLWTRRS